MTSQRAAHVVAAATDVGRRRTVNEDSLVVQDRVLQADHEQTRLAVDAADRLRVAVLDGLGGHPDGDVASRLAATAIARADIEVADVGSLVDRAHAAVRDGVAAGRGRGAMGTTLAMVLVEGHRITVANVGDSDVHRIGDDGLVRVSRPDRVSGGMLTQTLGGAPAHVAVRPHVRSFEVDAPTRLLLSSDGLTDVLDLPTIERLVSPAVDATDAVTELVRATLDAGAPDNVTVVIVDVTHG